MILRTCLALPLALACYAQIGLFQIGAGGETPVPSLMDLGAAAPVLRLNNGDLVFAEDSGVCIRPAGADDAHIALTLPDRAVASSAGQPQYAVRLTAGREQAYQIPEAP